MDEIELVAYDAEWPHQFDAELVRLNAALPSGLACRIEHIGSTAVYGLSAKPIIDIMILTPSLDVAKNAVETLQCVGYEFWDANPRLDLMFFVKGLPPKALRRTHHLHITADPEEIKDRCLFRDYLRTHRHEALAYEQLKRALATAHSLNREAYTEAKTDYIKHVLVKARTQSRCSKVIQTGDGHSVP